MFETSTRKVLVTILVVYVFIVLLLIHLPYLNETAVKLGLNLSYIPLTENMETSMHALSRVLIY